MSFLRKVIATLPSGSRILDAGAGELRNKPICSHLNYVSQDICQYDGVGNNQGLHTNAWDTKKIDIVSDITDITDIPEPDKSFDVILCSEVFEHLPDPLKALNEFSRLLKPGGILIVTAPFNSLVHFAPYHFSTGFSRYWYEWHLPINNFEVEELSSNGDWFDVAKQELIRLPSVARHYGDWSWPFAYIFAGFGMLYFLMRPKNDNRANDLACFGWHCIAVKKT
jgi:SAM-dependent methyltransferase